MEASSTRNESGEINSGTYSNTPFENFGSIPLTETERMREKRKINEPSIQLVALSEWGAKVI